MSGCLSDGVAGVLAAFDAAVEYVPEAQKIRFTCTDPDDQHFLDLASAHKALLVSKDKAVLKLRKRVAQYYGATVGNMVEYSIVETSKTVDAVDSIAA